MRGRTAAKVERRAHGAALRFVAWVLSAFFFAGQLGTAAHFLAVKHGICPEHGELVHLERAADRGAERGPDRGLQGAHGADLGARVDGDVHPHASASGALASRSESADPGFEREAARANVASDEHCPTASVPRRDRAVLAPSAATAVLAPPRAAPVLAGADAPRALRSVALLELAPKLSPPARA